MDLSNLMSSLGGANVDPTQLTGAVEDLFASKGGVDGLVNTLKSGGLENEVNSWISTGSNQPADPQKVGSALGPDTINDLAAKVGITPQMLLPLLASLLPMIIDHLTPGGNLPTGGGTGGMGDLGGIIGGVLGQGGLGGILGGSNK